MLTLGGLVSSDSELNICSMLLVWQPRFLDEYDILASDIHGGSGWAFTDSLSGCLLSLPEVDCKDDVASRFIRGVSSRVQRLLDGRYAVFTHICYGG